MTARVRLKRSLVVSLKGPDAKTTCQSQSKFVFDFELLSELRVAVVRSEKVVAEAGAVRESRER
jgi:hypothetical protein